MSRLIKYEGQPYHLTIAECVVAVSARAVALEPMVNEFFDIELEDLMNDEDRHQKIATEFVLMHNMGVADFEMISGDKTFDELIEFLLGE